MDIFILYKILKSTKRCTFIFIAHKYNIYLHYIASLYFTVVWIKNICKITVTIVMVDLIVLTQ